MCLPRSEGGLGCRDLASWNIALMLKHLWCIVKGNDQLIWVEWRQHFFIEEKKYMGSKNTRNLLLELEKAS